MKTNIFFTLIMIMFCCQVMAQNDASALYIPRNIKQEKADRFSKLGIIVFTNQQSGEALDAEKIITENTWKDIQLVLESEILK